MREEDTLRNGREFRFCLTEASYSHVDRIRSTIEAELRSKNGGWCDYSRLRDESASCKLTAGVTAYQHCETVLKSAYQGQQDG